MKIAIIGSGISGLTAASVLHRRHEVTVFEAQGRIGGHTNTIAVQEGDRRVGVDTGFIVFNEENYPNLCRLFERYDVPTRSSDMSFSVHTEDGGLAYNGSSFDAMFTQRRNLLRPAFLRMLADILRFNRDAPRRLANGLDDSITVAEFAARNGYGRAFVEHYLVPLGASLWSCDAERFRDFPMRFVVEFLHNHHMLKMGGRPVWKTVRGGSVEYLHRMRSEFGDRILLDSPVVAVRRRGAGLEVETEGGACERFDEVILAGHADDSLAVLREAEDEERELLAAFPYRDNEVVLHTDTGMLPAQRKSWASWNYRIPATEHDRVTVTYNMNMLQGLESERTYCVSLNQSAGIAPERLLRRIRYRHPSFGPGRAAAQAAHAQLIRRRGVSCCGAYWGYGFHEDGVRSALAVCEGFGLSLDSDA